MAIIGRFFELIEINARLMAIRLQSQATTAKFAPVVQEQIFQSAGLGCQPVQHGHYVFATQALPDLEGQELVAVYIDDCQAPELHSDWLAGLLQN